MTQLDSPAVGPSTASPLAADEREELALLRREIQAMQSAPAQRARRKFRWRSLLATLLIVLGCVLAPVAGVSVWLHNQVSDTDRFVRTMSPLISDPDVQNALTERLTATVFEYVDVQGLADDAVDALAAQGLPPQIADRLGTLTPTLASAVTGFAHDRIAELVASEAFVSAWNKAIQVAHRQMVSVLSGNSEGVVIKGDTVYLDLAPFIGLVKQRLSDAGLTAVDLVPEVHPTVALVKADTLVRAQGAYSTLDAVATVLPWLVLLLLVVGVYLSRNRSRALVGTGLGVALAMVFLGAALLVARSLLIGAVPAAAATATASGFDIVVTYLRLGLRALLVLGLVLAVAGFLAGRSDSAVRIRRSTAGHLHRIRGGPSADSRLGRAVRGHLRGLRVGAVAIAVLAFVFMEQPTGVTILVIAVLLLLALAVIEFLGRPPTPADDGEVRSATAGMPVPSAPVPAATASTAPESSDVHAVR